MKKNVMFIAVLATILLASCSSKKELLACQEEYKAVKASLQSAREELAGKNVKIESLTEQLAASKKAIAEMQKTNNTLQQNLAQSLNNASQTDMSRLQSLVDRRDESYSTATNLMTSISDTRSNLIRNL